MAIVSRRIAKPLPGKTDVVMSRVTRFKDLVIKAGAKARAAKFVGVFKWLYTTHYNF